MEVKKLMFQDLDLEFFNDALYNEAKNVIEDSSKNDVEKVKALWFLHDFDKLLYVFDQVKNMPFIGSLMAEKVKENIGMFKGNPYFEKYKPLILQILGD